MQTLINLMMTVKDERVMQNFEGGLWSPDTVDTEYDSVEPYRANEGLTRRYGRYKEFVKSIDVHESSLQVLRCHSNEHSIDCVWPNGHNHIATPGCGRGAHIRNG